MKFLNNSCLLLIDIQTDYSDIFDFNTFKNNIIKLLKKARKERLLIIFIFEIDCPYKSFWIPFYEEMKGNRKLDQGKPFSFNRPKQNEIVFIKNGYDGFFNTQLNIYLKNNDIKNIYIGGLLTGVCVLNTIFSGFNLGYRIILIENCCSDRSKERHKFVITNYSNYLFLTENI